MLNGLKGPAAGPFQSLEIVDFGVWAGLLARMLNGLKGPAAGPFQSLEIVDFGVWAGLLARMLNGLKGPAAAPLKAEKWWVCCPASLDGLAGWLAGWLAAGWLGWLGGLENIT